MKICILAPRYPFPEVGGDVLRINNIARYLKQHGHELTLLAYNDFVEIYPDKEDLYDHIYVVKRNKWISYFYSLLSVILGKPLQCGYYRSRSYGRMFRKLIAENDYDLYISHLIRMIPYLEENGLEAKSIVEMTDALSNTYAMSGTSQGPRLLRLIYLMEARRIKAYEQHVIKRFPKVVLVSQKDIDSLNSIEMHENVVLHTNGVKVCKHPSTTYDPDKICFIGNMRTLQNTDAAIYFVKEVFPYILKKRPTAKLYIVGGNATAEVKALASDNVILTGFLEDLNIAFHDACVVVAPIRVAAGIQNKVLVAMAYRVPIVLSSLIATAIPELKNGENCYIADYPAVFADRCLRLMEEPSCRDTMAEKGYQMVKNNYSWYNKLNGYEKL